MLVTLILMFYVSLFKDNIQINIDRISNVNKFLADSAYLMNKMADIS